MLFTVGVAFLPSATGVLAGSAALIAGATAAGWVLLRHDGWSGAAAGLVLDRGAVAETARGLLLGVGVAGGSVAGMALFGGLRWVPDGAEWSAGAWFAEGVRAMGWFALPAAAEEVLLRGYALAAMARVWGPGVALGGTSVVFGLLHGANPEVGALGLLGVTAAGLWLGALVLKWGSIWPAIGAHLGWNWGIGYGGDVAVSGLEVADAPGYDGLPVGADWLSGGGFGVEASGLAIAALTLAAWMTWRSKVGGAPGGRRRPMWIR